MFKKVVHEDQPENRREDGSLGETFRERSFPTGRSLPWNRCFMVAEESTDPPDV